MNFTDLPPEIIQSILFFLPPETLIDVCKTSKRLNTIADTPLLWRYHCRTQYRFWDSIHHIEARFRRPVKDTSWKSLFWNRWRNSRWVDQCMDLLINNSQDRIRIIETMMITKYICTDDGEHTSVLHSYDVKDALLRHCNAPEDGEDCLARRYWAKAVLERLHRALAIQEWKKLRSGTVQLHRAFGAYDMFVLGTEDGDYSDIELELSKLASTLLEEHPKFYEFTTRRKAVLVAEFLRAHGFTGTSEEEYHNLQNNFIGRALLDPDHQAMPLVCIAIYCSIATRVGLIAHPSGFPLHVYGIVSSPVGEDLDGKKLSPEESQDRMYIDAFHSMIEVPTSHLEAQLRSMGAGDLGAGLFLGPAGILEITLRASRNIMHSVQNAQLQARNHPPNGGSRLPTWFRISPDMDSSFYASLWAIMLLQDQSSAGNARRRHYLPFLCEYFQNHCPWDAALIQQHITPLFHDYAEYEQLLEILDYARTRDRTRPPPIRRDGKVASKVKYRIGQVLRHKRYGYEGVIIKWDTSCDATDTWINQMGVDNLDGGRYQCFYTVLVDDKSSRYVAEENIDPIDDKPSAALMIIAGRYFRRWDPQTRRFISNIKDEYPDD